MSTFVTRTRQGLREVPDNAYNAFTLIELLVVVAVIALLAAMLLPVLSRARSQADSAVCRGNLHQLTLALSMYAEQSGAYPQGVSLTTDLRPFLGAVWPSNNYVYISGVPSYLGPRYGVYACPGYNQVRGEFSKGVQERLIWHNSGAYGYNWQGVVRSGSSFTEVQGLAFAEATAGLRPVPTAQVVAPNDMIALGDSIFWAEGAANGRNATVPSGSVDLLRPALYDSGAYAGLMRMMQGLPADDPLVQTMGRRHGGRWNMGFCDAHVENLRLKQLFDFANLTVARRWNRDHLPHWQFPQ